MREAGATLPKFSWSSCAGAGLVAQLAVRADGGSGRRSMPPTGQAVEHMPQPAQVSRPM